MARHSLSQRGNGLRLHRRSWTKPLASSLLSGVLAHCRAGVAALAGVGEAVFRAARFSYTSAVQRQQQTPDGAEAGGVCVAARLAVARKSGPPASGWLQRQRARMASR